MIIVKKKKGSADMARTVRAINFDMDGTIANLYGVENCLDDLVNKRVRPYRDAKPLVNMSLLARLLNKLAKKGYEINVISWLAKNSTPDYDEMVANTKREWLAKHLASVKFDNIHIVPYGTPKETLGNGILFDDEEPNRNNWNGIAYDVDRIIETLKNLEKTA